jgi:hypothetical protein
MMPHPRFGFGAPSLLAGLLFFLIATPLAAQVAAGGTLDGRVILGDGGVAGVGVELHRVTPSTSGVVSTTTSDGEGGFSFTLPPLDTTGFTVFFATVEYGSVRYFGRPLHPDDDPGVYRVEVFDTTSTPGTPPVVARRDLVFMPEQGGSWEINEIVRLRNSGRRTIVSASGMPTAEVVLPSGAVDFEAGDGDSPADQFQRMGDRVLLLLPLLPGEREVFFRYRLPARPSRIELAMSAAAPDTLNVFVRQPAPRLTVEGLRPSELIEVEGERFLQYRAGDGPVAGIVALEWERSGPPVDPIVAALAATVLVLVGGAVVAYRKRPG